MRTASASEKTTGRQDDGTTGAMYANDSAMYASNRSHDEGNEVDGDKQQVYIKLTTRQ